MPVWWLASPVLQLTRVLRHRARRCRLRLLAPWDALVRSVDHVALLPAQEGPVSEAFRAPELTRGVRTARAGAQQAREHVRQLHQQARLTHARSAALRQRAELVRLQSIPARLQVPAPLVQPALVHPPLGAPELREPAVTSHVAGSREPSAPPGSPR